MKKIVLFVLVVFIFIEGFSEPRKKKRRNIEDLSKSEIEYILSTCCDDTLQVLGQFIHFGYNIWESAMYESCYYAVADVLNWPIQTSSDISVIKEAVHELYRKTRGTEMSVIAIPSNFVPKIKITNELNRSSLQDLITKDITSKNIHVKYKQEPNSRSIVEMILMPTSKKDDIKYISDKANLTKVFFLQDKENFIKLNKYYYHTIRKKYMEEYLNKQKQIEIKSAQSTWNEYLK